MIAYGENCANQKLTPAKLTSILRRFVGNSGISVQTHRDNAVHRNQVVISGFYDPDEDEANLSSITIYATYHPKQKFIYIKNIDWAQLCIDLIECTGHEIVHQVQYRSREFDVGPHIFVSMSESDRKRADQEYLGNADEVEAYGYSIAAEVFLKYAPKELTHRYITRSSLYKVYASAFGREHTIVKNLARFAVSYYNSLTRGHYVKVSTQLVK